MFKISHCMVNSVLIHYEGLTCSTCDQATCADSDVVTCGPTETHCMILKVFAASGNVPPIRRCAESALLASCMEGMDNMCYNIEDRVMNDQSCRKEVKDFAAATPSLTLAATFVSGLRGKICRCNTDMCNNDYSLIMPASTTTTTTTLRTTTSSGTVPYGKLNRLIVLLMSVLLRL